MRRLRAIVVILALLATPLALLARGMACEAAACTMCCPMHASHSHSGQPMACQCSTKSRNSAPDFGLIAPITPTRPAPRVTVFGPEVNRQLLSSYAQSAVSGFLSAPLQPPRA
ncbi:MAG TPA: hypothetical protein VN822_08085 [Candidatus Acidoferrales bacterium]|nr:hypothetical protein [Candidatus Acidoferrales bacterium]